MGHQQRVPHIGHRIDCEHPADHSPIVAATPLGVQYSGARCHVGMACFSGGDNPAALDKSARISLYAPNEIAVEKKRLARQYFFRLGGLFALSAVSLFGDGGI